MCDMCDGVQVDRLQKEGTKRFDSSVWQQQDVVFSLASLIMMWYDDALQDIVQKAGECHLKSIGKLYPLQQPIVQERGVLFVLQLYETQSFTSNK